MTDDDMQQRLTALESRIAYYEAMAEDVSDVLTRQGREIDRLTLLVYRLRERIGELETGGWSPSPQDEKPPPHY